MNYKFQNGFTLIELSLVIVIIGIISTVGLSSFTSFNRSQLFGTGTSEVVSLLNTARSRAISQVASACGVTVLNGYKVIPALSSPSNTYGLYAVCGGVDQLVGTAKKLPGQLTFQSDSAASIFFDVGTGIVSTSGSFPRILTLTGYGKTQAIYINKVGNVCYTSC